MSTEEWLLLQYTAILLHSLGGGTFTVVRICWYLILHVADALLKDDNFQWKKLNTGGGGGGGG